MTPCVGVTSAPTCLPQRRWASALLRFRLVAHRADAFAAWNSLAAVITAALDALFVVFLLQQQSLIDLWKGYTTLAVIVMWAACVVAAALVFPAQRLVDGMLRSGRLDADDDRWDKCKKAPMVMRPGAEGVLSRETAKTSYCIWLMANYFSSAVICLALLLF